jgi:S1-C subfamily serine protease
VVPGSPASTSGLSTGDTITSLNGHAVGSSTDLRSVLDGLRPGQRVNLTWTSPGGRNDEAAVTLASAQG